MGGRLEAGVVQSVLDGVRGQRSVAFDGPGEVDERGQPGSSCPGEPPGEKLSASFVFGGEHDPVRCSLS